MSRAQRKAIRFSLARLAGFLAIVIGGTLIAAQVASAAPGVLS